VKRNALLHKLAAYRPTTAVDAAAQQQIIAFVQEHPDCFERSLAIGHITASAWVLNKTGDKALLMHHAKLNQWMQLGGHCDGDPDVLAVAIKEAQEESGIEDIVPVHEDIFDLDVHAIPATPKEAAHYHYDVRFLLRVAGDADFVRNHESHDMRWFGAVRDQLPTAQTSVVRMFDKWSIYDSV
jgi:8-oxo-dGTP pyrophosphatase MutT (NUDIX family)